MEAELSRRRALGRLVNAAGLLAFAAREALGVPPRKPRSVADAAGQVHAPAFDRLAREHGFRGDGPGLAVLIQRPPKRGTIHCFGLADVVTMRPITPRTTFELASVTKPITSTAALMLVERKMLALGEDVRKYIPELPVYNPERPIRVEDLLRHTSGLPDYLGFGDVPMRNGDYAVNDDFVAEFARREDARLVFPTGRKHEYNNTNYMLLATVIARASKQTYAGFLRENILGPVGMDETFVYDSPAAVPQGAAGRAAIGYVREGDVWKPDWALPPIRKEPLLTVGDGGVWSSIADMGRWDAALHGGKLVSAETAKLALSTTKTPDGETHGYGLGWGLYFGDGGVMNGYGHDGSWGGFIHSYYHEPGENLTTVILSNRGDFDADKFWYQMRDLIAAGRLGRQGDAPG